MAQLQREDLAIILLDFEKAYKRVDWGFLEGTMLHVGFTPKCFRGVVALYSSTHSKVFVDGDYFTLSRSFKQGYPLALLLFIFFDEVMSGFLIAHDVGLQGLSLPILEEELPDAKFANDTAMFLTGCEANLIRF